MKRREPGIVNLVKRYNDLCAQMENLIRQRQAPAGALAPIPLPREHLFTLDIDHAIWEDVGLDDYTGEGGLATAVPRWLGDDHVRKGIRAMLQLDRCNEEDDRLSREVVRLGEWADVEWRAIGAAKQHASWQ